ncbi:MAG: S-layer homology domain-containing protein [Candidatus Peribacteraceae bacterium]|nr:S-layer homology domain-containing protein [Candidatus Peribacteraceae bacterium]MDD5742865.1 S-layer homology domain-containing protein [Candidatus Peribacteraceae bacterium]
MSSRSLSALLACALLLPQLASAYFPEDVTLPPVAPVMQMEEPLVKALPPPLPAVEPVAYTWNADATIRRSTFVAAIVRRLFKPSQRCFPKLSESDYSLLASDVEKDASYGIDLCTAMRGGLMRGFTDGTFRPNALVTRAEAAKALAKAFELATDPTDPSEPWFDNYVKALIDGGALSADASLNGPITRGELSKMLWTVRAMTKEQ